MTDQETQEFNRHFVVEKYKQNNMLMASMRQIACNEFTQSVRGVFLLHSSCIATAVGVESVRQSCFAYFLIAICGLGAFLSVTSSIIATISHLLAHDIYSKYSQNDIKIDFFRLDSPEHPAIENAILTMQNGNEDEQKKKEKFPQKLLILSWFILAGSGALFAVAFISIIIFFFNV